MRLGVERLLSLSFCFSLFLPLLYPAVPFLLLMPTTSLYNSFCFQSAFPLTNSLKASEPSTRFILRCTILTNIFNLHLLRMCWQVSLLHKKKKTLQRVYPKTESLLYPKIKGLFSNFSWYLLFHVSSHSKCFIKVTWTKTDWLYTLFADAEKVFLFLIKFFFFIACHTFKYVCNVYGFSWKKKNSSVISCSLPFSVYLQYCYRCYCSYSQSIPL